MKSTKKIALLFFSCVIVFYMAGCGNKFFDPTQIGRFRPIPAVNIILDSLGVAEEAPVTWDNAEEPRPSDVIAIESDYVLQSGDVLRISIYELFQEGIFVISDYIISETGKISIPEVGVMQAAGLTETQLEEEIEQILSPSILKEPSVTVTMISSQQYTYSVLGDGVPAPGRYSIPRYGYRLTEALARAGGPRQFNVSYIYVSRSEKDKEQVTEPVQQEVAKSQFSELKTFEPEITSEGVPKLAIPEQRSPEWETIDEGLAEPKEPIMQPALEREMLELIAPMAKHRWPESRKMITATELSKARKLTKPVLPSSFELLRTNKRTNTKAQNVVAPAELGFANSADEKTDKNEINESIEWIFENGRWIPVRVGPRETVKTEPVLERNEVDEGIEWIFKDGEWVPIQRGLPKPEKPAIKFEPEKVIPLEEKLPEELEWEEAIQARLIKIPVDKLLAGDPRYNIVVKPGDSIFVPVDIVGEFCIMGNVNRSGYVNITGRPMTLKMAIAAAGGLGPLAWPKKCEVVRRIGREKEEIVMVDLDKIANGEQPDFFIKPHDLINVGTHPTARWRAVLRNAFRATYGFGFVYDRNFAYRDYYGTAFNPVTPWKWGNVF
jgi:protein involved in polysaccharide export with SLBB domain